MDFSWFATIPGMLITGGVLLLIISLVMFIAMSNKKGKKSDASKKSEEGAKNMVNEMQQSSVVATDNTVNVSNVVDPMAVSNGINVPESSIVDNQMPSNVGTNDLSAMPIGGSIGAEVAAPEVASPVSNFDVPPVSDSQPVAPLQSDNVMGDAVTMAQDPASVSNIGDVPTPAMPDTASAVPVMPEVAAPMSNDVTPVSNAAPGVETPVMPEPAPVASSINADIATAPVMPEVSADSPVTGINIPIAGQVESSTVTPSGGINSTVPEVPTVNATPAVAPISAVGAVSAVTLEPTPVAPVVDVNSQPQSSVPIYGGADPTIPSVSVEQDSHQIYGGANPLENTQNISLADINQAAADAISHNSASTTPPVVGVPNVAPVQNVEVVPVAPVQPVTPVQSVAPVQPVTPEVVAAPNVVSAPNQGQ